MASIQLRNFGGMAPSANPQAISEAQATWVQNLNLRFADFRPLAAPAVATAATAGQSLHRFESTGAFITRAGIVNFVRGPIPNDATERTYYSGDGAPKVVDNTGAVRQLGVPQPAAAPVATVNALAQFSEDDAKAARLNKFAEIMDKVRANLTAPLFGLEFSELDGFDQMPSDPTSFLFRIPGSLSSAGNFMPANASHSNLNDWRLGFTLYGSNPVKAGSLMQLRATGMGIGTGMAAALQTVTAPGSAQPLIAPDMATGIVATLTDAIKVADTNRDECIARMRTRKAEYVALANTGDPGSSASRGEVEAFYARADIAGIIGAAVTTAVSDIIGALQSYTGGSGSPLPITGKPGQPGYYVDPL